MVKFEEYDKPELYDGKQSYTTEMLGGVKFDRTASTLRHQIVRQNLLFILSSIIKSQKGEVIHGLGIRFDEKNFLIPDISGFCANSKYNTEDAECAPDFVIEVTSPTTRRNDMTVKKDIYARFGIMEYWIVDPKAQTIDLYTLNPVTLALEFDSCYHNITEDELDWEHLSAQEKGEVSTAIKSRMLVGVDIPLKDIFAID